MACGPSRPNALMDIHVVILAAGKGTRMKSALPKVLHRVAGATLIDHVLRAAAALRPATTTVVVGHMAETVRASLAHHPALAFVVHEPQLGTAHAMTCTRPVLDGRTGTVVLLSGDVPQISGRTLEALVARHAASAAAATVVTAIVDDPHGYGRIVREHGEMTRIVEQRDATPPEQAIREINAGIYAFALDGLFDALSGVAAGNAQGEYYLPDLVAIHRRNGRAVATITVENPDEIHGINSRRELAAVGRTMRQTKNDELMAAGVTIEDPATTYVDLDVTVGPDTVIHPGVSLQGTTTIGTGCEIHSGVRLVNARLGDGVTVYDHSLVTDSVIESRASVGPFAHLRQHANVGEGAKVGNFVEMKKTTLGPRSKSMHLTYLGDAVIGADVNIGAGTITCNYDGVKKHTTTIEAGAFVGSDTQLIAPVTVGAGAYVGSGTTLRESVPPGALAVSAGKQRNIEGWVERKKPRKA